MNISGQHQIAAAPQKVWEALNDPTVLKTCIPGCQDLKMLSPTEIEASILAQLGPVKATFAARITLADLNPPHSYTLSGEGKSGVAGFGRGEARVSLTEQAGETLLQYTADLKLGGKIAQLGSRLIEGTTRKLAEEFFAKFASQLASSTQVPQTGTARRPSHSWAWILLAVAAAAAVITWWVVRSR
jgi:carbon monoxide dehydrogenase subunit G